MTLKLVLKYNMKEDYIKLRDNNFGYKDGEFDQKKAGHGIKLEKRLD